VEKRLAARRDEVRALRAEALDAAVAAHVRAYFDADGHADAAVDAAVSRQIDAAVSRHVDAALQARLPHAVENLLVPKDVPSSPATSFTSEDSRGLIYPKLPPLTRLGRNMLPHLREHLTEQFRLLQEQQLQRFEKFTDKIESAAQDGCARQYADFEIQVEELQREMSWTKQETLDDLRQQGDEMIEQSKDECAAFGETVTDQMTDIWYGFCDKVSTVRRCWLRNMVAVELSKQDTWRKMVAVEFSRQRTWRNIRPRGFGRFLLRGEHKPSGARQEPGEEAWVDVI
jgi:hypothetical protein